MNYLKNKFKEIRQEIILENVKELPELINVADELVIKIKEKNLNIEQFSFKKETDVSLEEQLKWLLSNITEKPVENYVWHYSLFNQAEQNEAMGLLCYFDRQELSAILNKYQNQNISLIASEDEQFIFYKNKIYFWQKKALLKNLAPLIMVVNLFLFVIFLSLMLTVSFKIKSLLIEKNMVQEKLTALENSFRIIQEGQSRKHQAVINKKENEKNCNLLVSLTEQTPADIFFNELVFSQNDIKVIGCDRASLTGVNSFIKNLKKNKEVQDVALLKTLKSDQGMNFDLKIVLKNKRTLNNKQQGEMPNV